MKLDGICEYILQEQRCFSLYSLLNTYKLFDIMHIEYIIKYTKTPNPFKYIVISKLIIRFIRVKKEKNLLVIITHSYL